MIRRHHGVQVELVEKLPLPVPAAPSSLAPADDSFSSTESCFASVLNGSFATHSLSNQLSLALQFAKLNIEQLEAVGKYEVSQEIAAIDAQITEGMTPDQLNNIEFQFRVIYTLDAAAKTHAHFHFVNPASAEGKEIHNVLSKKVAADDLYPHKPSVVAKLVKQKSGHAFTSNDHTKAWRLFKARPKTGNAQPENTDKRYCIYHSAHKDYT